MRVLVVHPGPEFSVSDVYKGLVGGLEANGCTVATLNLNDRLEFYNRTYMDDGEGGFRKALDQDSASAMAAQGIEVACYETWPDIVVIVSGWFIPPHIWGVLKKRPHHVVYWCTESPYEDDRQAQPARYVDTVILNDPTNLDAYRADINKRTFYMPHSYDPKVHYSGPADPELECDFGFAGTGFPSRIEFFEQVDWTNVDAKFGGMWQGLEDGSPLRRFMVHDIDQCMPNHLVADLYRSAKVGANLYRKEHSEQANADGWAMGPREVELAACGSFFLREPRGEGDDLFPMLPTFTTPAEFTDLMRWYLAHPDQRRAAALAAQAAVADRTFKNAATNLLRLVDSSKVLV